MLREGVARLSRSYNALAGRLRVSGRCVCAGQGNSKINGEPPLTRPRRLVLIFFYQQDEHDDRMKTMKINVTLTFEVDLEQWADEYGLDLDQAKADARNFIPALVREYVGEMSHVQNGIIDYIRKDDE